MKWLLERDSQSLPVERSWWDKTKKMLTVLVTADNFSATCEYIKKRKERNVFAILIYLLIRSVGLYHLHLNSLSVLFDQTIES